MNDLTSELVTVGGRNVEISHHTEDRCEAFYIDTDEQYDERAQIRSAGTYVVTERTATLPAEFDRQYGDIQTYVYFRYYKVEVFVITVNGKEVHTETGKRQDIETYVYDHQPATPEYLDGLDMRDGYRKYRKDWLQRFGAPCVVSARAPYYILPSDPATTHQAVPDPIVEG